MMVFALGMFCGAFLSGYVFWGMLQKEKEELKRMMLITLGYEHMKNLARGGQYVQRVREKRGDFI